MKCGALRHRVGPLDRDLPRPAFGVAPARAHFAAGLDHVVADAERIERPRRPVDAVALGDAGQIGAKIRARLGDGPRRCASSVSPRQPTRAASAATSASPTTRCALPGPNPHASTTGATVMSNAPSVAALTSARSANTASVSRRQRERRRSRVPIEARQLGVRIVGGHLRDDRVAARRRPRRARRRRLPSDNAGPAIFTVYDVPIVGPRNSSRGRDAPRRACRRRPRPARRHRAPAAPCAGAGKESIHGQLHPGADVEAMRVRLGIGCAVTRARCARMRAPPPRTGLRRARIICRTRSRIDTRP